jgi:hypothetical protein
MIENPRKAQVQELALKDLELLVAKEEQLCKMIRMRLDRKDQWLHLECQEAVEFPKHLIIKVLPKDLIMMKL